MGEFYGIYSIFMCSQDEEYQRLLDKGESLDMLFLLHYEMPYKAGKRKLKKKI